MISSRTLVRMMAPGLALCLCAGVAAAQDRPSRDHDRRERHDQARQPGDADGNHPLWRHPVDVRVWRRNQATPGDARQVVNDAPALEGYRAAYGDGYHDGFHDDEFGAEYWSSQWDPGYASAYTDGYYDGHYDRKLEYGFDPTYYVYLTAVPVTHLDEQEGAERRRGEQRRQSDQTRARGDRVGAAASAGRARQGARDVEPTGALELVRGDVAEISEDRRSDFPDHTVLRIRFRDRDDVTADFGPHMSREQIPFARGDRVSLVGYHTRSDQGDTMVVSSIVHEGRVHQLRSAEEALEQRDADPDRGERNRGGG